MTDDSSVLVIAPHPDDMEYGAGGTVAAWVKAGRQVVLVVCTSGDKGSSDPHMTPERLAVIRREEQDRAAEVLGVAQVVFLGLPDQGLEDSAAFRRSIVRLIRQHRPHTVATTDPYRKYLWHRDHRITGQVTLDAVYPYARDHLAYPDLATEGLTPHKTKEVWLWGTEDINQVSDVTPTFELKLAALRCHRSQTAGLTGPGQVARLRKRAEAAADGYPFLLGEAFHRVCAPD